MELQGKVIAILPERSGVSARGEWKSQSFVIETHDQYPRKLVFDVFGADRLAQFAINSGDEISVSFDIDAHEFNGRWFNNIRAWAVNHVDPAAVAAASAPQAASASPTGSAQAPFPPTQPAAALPRHAGKPGAAAGAAAAGRRRRRWGAGWNCFGSDYWCNFRRRIRTD